MCCPARLAGLMNHAKSFIFMGDINKDSGIIIAIISLFYSDHEKSQQFYSLLDLKSII